MLYQIMPLSETYLQLCLPNSLSAKHFSIVKPCIVIRDYRLTILSSSERLLNSNKVFFSCAWHKISPALAAWPLSQGFNINQSAILQTRNSSQTVILDQQTVRKREWRTTIWLYNHRLSWLSSSQIPSASHENDPNHHSTPRKISSPPFLTLPPKSPFLSNVRRFVTVDHEGPLTIDQSWRWEWYQSWRWEWYQYCAV